MASVIASAISRGYSARTILNQISRQFPKAANAIHTASIAGYTADTILRHISNSKSNDPDQFLTEREKYHKNVNSNKRKAALEALGLLGTAGAVAAGGIALASRNKAIRPSEILPAIRQPQKPRQLSPSQQRRLIAPITGRPTPPIAPNQPTPQAPVNLQQETPQATVPRDIMRSVDFVKNIKEDPRFEMAIKSGHDPKTTSLILRSIIPKNKIALLDKAEGGLEQVVEDYTNHLNQLQTQIKETQKNIISPEVRQEPKSFVPPESQTQNQLQPQAQSTQIEQPLIEIKPEIKTQEPIPFEREQPIQEQPQIMGNLALLPKGQIGEIESVNKGIAKINVDGNIKNVKLSDLKQEPQDVEQAVREIVNSIPENMKSTALQSMVHVPEMNLLLTQFYDGKFAWYKDVPEETYRNISLGLYEPKGQARTGIGEYKPGIADSRGAGFHNEIKINPKYSKENKGITWGYATNEYNLLHSIQKSLHKISKEKYDEEGNPIIPKKRKKSSSE